AFVAAPTALVAIVLMGSSPGANPPPPTQGIDLAVAPGSGAGFAERNPAVASGAWSSPGDSDPSGRTAAGRHDPSAEARPKRTDAGAKTPSAGGTQGNTTSGGQNTGP